ncbi:MAG: hypothetical protein NTU73_08815 [Ignavibacteriae bacterium]|nr:hypothetical protein [Ignavibacteriota bacterium]
MVNIFKKTFIILLAFILAFSVLETVIGNIFGFPKYGVVKKMKGMRSSPGHQNIYKPYSEYWNAKGKFEIYKRNNLGLPGIDVDTSKNSRYICVLGSSFIENNYLNPKKMATSVFQKLIKKSTDFNVLNLGYNGFDPYDCFRRLAFYEITYKPECIILVINAYNSDSYKLFDNPFQIDSNSFYTDNSFKTRLNLLLRNNFSFARLTLTMFQNRNDEQIVEPQEDIIDANTVDLNDLFICLSEFNKKYGDKFICVSIINNDTVNCRIDEYCKNNNISNYYSNIMIPENQIYGDWHLNEKGNEVLGNYLFESFCKQYKIKI